jgi:ABC-type transporter Mla MlaB component
MAASPPRTITFAIWGPIARGDLPGLSSRVCALLARTGAGVALCDVASVEVDAVTADALARLQLAARRQRCQIRLRNAPKELRDLIAFMGLEEILPE